MNPTINYKTEGTILYHRLEALNALYNCVSRHFQHSMSHTLTRTESYNYVCHRMLLLEYDSTSNASYNKIP